MKKNKQKNKQKNKKHKTKQLKKKNQKNTYHKYLCYTNLLLIISMFFFLYKTRIRHQPTNKIEYFLATSLIATIIFSQLFWKNPIKHSKIHKIDAIIAKIVISSFILYTLSYKFKLIYLLILSAIVISFYFSNHYSSQEWCSNKHLCCHGSLHLLCFVATFYAFL
jgi:membrane-associated HD superfamily phosphohydrolase